MKEVTVVGCFLYLVFFVIALYVATQAFAYNIWTLFGKTAPLWVDVVLGVILSEVSVPVAIALWLLSFAGIVHAPLFR